MNSEQKKRFALALERVAGDCDLLVAMANLVTEDGPGVWAEVQRNLAEEQWQSLASSTHKLKGMLATFETRSPIPELQEMIQAARKERLDEVRSCFAGCRSDVEHLLKEINDLASVPTNG